MKRIGLILLVCAGALFFMAACGQKSAASEQQSAAEEAPIRIGIAKIVQHVALDACEQGIIDALEARGVKAEIDRQNANGDANTAAQIAAKFKSDRVNVAVGIATPVAVALANTIKDVPVVFSVVTDPVGAGLVSTLEKGQGNVTGLSDAIPTGDHIALFKELANIKTLGYIYTSSEANSISALALVEAACKNLGLQLVTQSINASAELRQAAQSIVNRVDGVYLTTDNTVFSALPALIQVFQTAKKPIFSGDVTGAMNGGCVIASGFNYYKAGVATGNMVADILGGKQPADTPVKFLTDPSESDLLFDLDAAKNCGITIPARYLDMANMIFENGALRNK
ncbi:ABC transporter substrate-binding protein [Spirochaetia bacterium]|nr:ABC transporter substrate-binding protein [Spirochaetia bacterium]